jgi:hypothetical protein
MDVITAAANVAEDYKGGARQLAHDIDRNATTFSHELNETGAAKLGLRTAVKMTMRSKDLRILNAFAAEVGQMCVPLPESLMVDGDMTMLDLGRVAKEFGDVVQEVSAAASDGEVTANELQRVERQWGELVAAGQRMLGHLRASHEQTKAARQELRNVA